MNFTEKDIKQIEAKNLTLDKVKAQIQIFTKGIPFVNLKAAANVGNGILKFSEEEKNQKIQVFEDKRNQKTILKFVPASGAATRMFKFLFQFIHEFDSSKETVNSYVNRKKSVELPLFLVGVEKFPFYKQVIERAEVDYPNYHSLSETEKIIIFTETILAKDKLNFGAYPKGLLPFHEYKNHVSTAFREHLFEAALYASSNNISDLHFTISEKHLDIFEEEFKNAKEAVEEATNTKFNVTFSFQCQTTDTIAVTPKNEPFREDNGEILFRPSGHGALLTNLNKLDADVIFIKNIDNTVVYKYKNEVAENKKILGGLLIELQEQAFAYLERLEDETISEAELISIAEFLKNKLHVVINIEFEKYSKTYQIEYLREKLNRPIRVCGMVKNEGEPGGGPFWIKDESGNVSLQIVESAQIDKKNKSQKKILKNATHFNPVDLVCGIKNYKGEKFDLKKYVDPNTAFITNKTKAGKDLKALELPGLWNGAMANWNTIFVEVPLITFNPVKTVTDLLKSAHQTKD
ncbi:DUF4301 family protein [Lacinutrix sp. C3R15]|uniref:DUF4301 family protein n=1 Tax=Flavobacteriaceae TaxID=49546 RepID=UPI001C082F18|nr:DUF4301 family protein [Oceanihabitans sp. 1_MG-2023]MBU2939010.1 DUF4301 family protein [Lacinutrix sp. C3R15]MDO6622325.1 DUF4301 family protein [Oceanihabitans sp. 1_MG-2023]